MEHNDNPNGALGLVIAVLGSLAVWSLVAFILAAVFTWGASWMLITGISMIIFAAATTFVAEHVR